MPNDVSVRFKKIRLAKDMTQAEMAALIGKNIRSIQNYESGERSVDTTTAILLSCKLGVNLDWFSTGEGGMFMDSAVGAGECRIPIYDINASAGYGAWANGEAITGYYAMPEELIKRDMKAKAGDLAMLKVSGDSMEPVLKNGDLIAIDISHTEAQSGMFVARVDNELYVKNISFHKDVVILSSVNPEYAPLAVPYDGFQLIGKVVWYARSLA